MVWTASYVVYPAVAAAFLVARRGRPAPPPGGACAPGWVRGVLIAHAAVFGLLLITALVARDVVPEGRVAAPTS